MADIVAGQGIQRYDLGSDWNDPGGRQVVSVQLEPSSDGAFVAYADHVIEVAHAVESENERVNLLRDDDLPRIEREAERRGYERGWNDGAAAMA